MQSLTPLEKTNYIFFRFDEIDPLSVAYNCIIDFV